MVKGTMLEEVEETVVLLVMIGVEFLFYLAGLTTAFI